MKKVFVALFFNFICFTLIYSRVWQEIDVIWNAKHFNFSDNYYCSEGEYTSSDGDFINDYWIDHFYFHYIKTLGVNCFQAVTDDDSYYYIVVDDIKSASTDDVFPDDMCTLMKNQKLLYPKYAVEAVSCQNRRLILRGDKKAVDKMYYPDENGTSYWYDQTPEPLLVCNAGMIFGGVFGNTTFLIKNIEYIAENKYVVSTVVSKVEDYDYPDSIYPEFHDGDEVTLRLKKDGDYLYIYVGEETKPRQTCCYVNNDFVAAVNQLVQSNWCDTTNLVWPKHADGTCDFKR